jgi:hypothetical protein
MLTTSQSNQSACEVCGHASEDRYARNQTARDSGYHYARTRTNRRLVDRVPSRLLAQYGSWVGKKVCRACDLQLIAAMNSK